MYNNFVHKYEEIIVTDSVISTLKYFYRSHVEKKADAPPPEKVYKTFTQSANRKFEQRVMMKLTYTVKVETPNFLVYDLKALLWD